ncbi:hypothetical protein SIL08_05545 [Scandinavium sp. V105_16]|uniref:Uncharacterized protein n=1 Tax=Scandinavium lactucae TaxID=3095028 RepID=A0AAJ2SAC5_9ENTR|nr:MULTISPECIES: hypothetical protein [unclassified Scandinavium]MDX6019754.1 hypothetical protein [Scandinavium sp. V105_16]MDX6032857.1 hypothetical protein [Scandinavium sp. V105_12]MDX6041198.1 hypothetical protein [Scandinavium sp. V105_6]MDX6049716.1 hypothetical protein [Scandinavium sp. V105_1]
MADWFIATEGVKVVKDSASLWPQIITAVSSAGAALVGVGLTHSFTRRREEATAARKRYDELYFIATELVFILERFAQRCTYAAQEGGSYDGDGKTIIEYTLPEISFSSVSGDWRSLPPHLMYRLIELPVLRQEAVRSINESSEEDTPYDGSDGIFELNHQASYLGLKAIRLSRSLRHLCEMPEDRLSDKPWSAWRILWHVRGRNIQQRMLNYRSSMEFNAALQQLVAGRDN